MTSLGGSSRPNASSGEQCPGCAGFPSTRWSPDAATYPLTCGRRIGRAERAAHWRPLQQRRSDTEGSGERGGVQSRDLGLILLLTLHPGQEKRPLSTAQKTCADIRHDLPNRVNFEAPSAGPGEAVLRFLSQLRGQPCLHPCKFSMASDTRAATPGSGGILLPLLGASMGPISELETTAAGEEGIRC